jgi:hypothetical protein
VLGICDMVRVGAFSQGRVQHGLVIFLNLSATTRVETPG